MTKESLRKLIGGNIRAERKARKMSRNEMSELLGLTPSAVSVMERGGRGPTVHTLYTLANAFDIPVDNFFLTQGGETLTFREEPERQSAVRDKDVKAKRAKVATLISDFEEAELDFIISTIKNIKTMRRRGDGENN